MNQEYTKTQKLTISAVCIALYLVVMLCTQSFAFGQYQVRIATALYGLSYIFPFLVVPFGIANVISNLFMGGLGPVDAIGGFIMGVLTSGVIALGKRYGLGCWIVAGLQDGPEQELISILKKMMHNNCTGEATLFLKMEKKYNSIIVT